MGVTSGSGTAYSSGAPEFTQYFLWGSCYSIYSFICMFCRSLFVFLYFFFWPLCCLFFFELRILITPLVSSNSSYCRHDALVNSNGKSVSQMATYMFPCRGHNPTYATPEFRSTCGSCCPIFSFLCSVFFLFSFL